MHRWELLYAAGTIVTLYLPILMVLCGTQSKAAQEKARARRIAEHQMNARLLRFNI